LYKFGLSIAIFVLSCKVYIVRQFYFGWSILLQLADAPIGLYEKRDNSKYIKCDFDIHVNIGNK